jgi:hypothetical protein
MELLPFNLPTKQTCQRGEMEEREELFYLNQKSLKVVKTVKSFSTYRFADFPGTYMYIVSLDINNDAYFAALQSANV